MFRYFLSNKKKCFILLCGAICLGIFLSDQLEPFLQFPAIRIMDAVSSGRFKGHVRDEKGVPLINIRRGNIMYYNPVYISMYAFAYYDIWQQSNKFDYFIRYYDLQSIKSISKEKASSEFINLANWLKDNISIYKIGKLEYGVWVYPIDCGICKAPWISAMAQGLAMEVLALAWQVTQDKSYLHASRLALNSLFVEIKEGGATYKDASDAWWYEEDVPAPEHRDKQPRILNGMEHVLISLFNYYNITHDRKAHFLFEQGFTALKKDISKFDLSWWSLYDLEGTIANYKYQQININLTKKIFTITKDPLFYDMYIKWLHQKTHFIKREFIYQKPNYHDVVILSLSIFLSWVCLVAIYILYTLTKKW